MFFAFVLLFAFGCTTEYAALDQSGQRSSRSQAPERNGPVLLATEFVLLIDGPACRWTRRGRWSMVHHVRVSRPIARPSRMSWPGRARPAT